MHRISAIFLRLVTTTVVLGFTISAHAQVNELANPGFTNDFSGWSQFNGRIADWSNVDEGMNPSSGSAAVQNQGTSDGIVPLVLFQCIQVQGQQEINFGGDLVVPELQPSGTAAYIFIEPFLNASCSGTAQSFHSTSSSFIGDWRSVSSSIVTPTGAQSVRLAIGVFKPNGESADALSFFDNLFLNLPEETGEFQIVPAMSASFFDPSQGGHGIMIHLIDANTAWMCWFTFNNAGDPVWICAIGTVSGDTITFENAFTVEGGAFPPDFDPDLIVEVPWGTIVVVFTGCDDGSMTWTTTAPGFQSGSMPLKRLTESWGTTCP